ncbi:MAG: thiolase family protein [Actinobacteria bacterium]|nr:thiolase family protein [Actinomycetota bacterium]
MKEIVICDGIRTINGKFLGGLSSLNAVDLGAIVLKELMKRNNLSEVEINEVIMAIVHQVGNRPNPARQVALKGGLPLTTTGWNLNSLCGSGVKAMNVAAQTIKTNEAKAIIVVGSESMSNAPYLVMDVRKGLKMSPRTFEDELFFDGFQDPFIEQPMGMTAENVAGKFNISREDQDKFAYNSHQKACKAVREGIFFEEIVPVEVVVGKGKTELLTKDECPREDTSLEKLAKLKPVFKEGGAVTAGNSCGLSDGASTVIITDSQYAEKNNLLIRAIIRGFADAGIEPAIMGFAPAQAIKNLLRKLNLKIEDIDLFEINEAFASQCLAVIKDLSLDPSRVNVNGGAIALGHPVGSSGVRIVLTLIRELKKRNKKLGVASLCSGGGQGNAVCIEVV